MIIDNYIDRVVGKKTLDDVKKKDQRHVREDLFGIMFVELKNLLETFHDFPLVFGGDGLEHNAPIFGGVDGSGFVHGNNLCFHLKLIFSFGSHQTEINGSSRRLPCSSRKQDETSGKVNQFRLLYPDSKNILARPLQDPESLSMIKLGKISLKTPVFQSPMADCTDIAFRLIARKLGLKLAFTEMISAEALVRENRRTLPLVRRVRGDKPLGAQLVGHNPVSMGKAAAMIEALGFDVLDLNFGCPVRKVTSPGAGSALLQHPDIAEKIFQNVMAQVKKIPVTIKMRTGFTDPSGKEALCLARLAEEHGLAAVTIHGRTRAQGYTGKADWGVIGLIKKAIKIPVFGNGDIFTPEDAKRMMEMTGCDGIAIGRGALGNPWLYAGIRAVLSGHIPKEPSFKEKKRVALEHIRLEVQYEGEKTGVLQSRKIAAWYFRGYPNVAQFRNQINRATTFKEISSLIKNFNQDETR